jgi:hypothetical protein
MKHLFSIFLFSISLFLFSSCQESSVGPNDNSGSISIGTFIPINQISVPTGGGVISVKSADSSINGLKITVPSVAYTIDKNFNISYANIIKHSFGANFNPISPLIKISNNGGYSNDIMIIKVPCKVPSGSFAMGFFYDEKSGKLEGLPIISFDSNSVTIATRHFASSTLNNGLYKIASNNNLESFSNLVISSIKESTLKATPIISSGYKPKVDDWEFVNYGSYLAPGGHCAGQTMTSMWYYYEQKKSQGNLYHKYDKVNLSNDKLWQDNPKGFRFASVVQNDIDFDSWNFNNQRDYIDTNTSFDELKFKALAYAMVLTGEPQFVAIWNLNVVNGKSSLGGHALTAYSVDYNSGKISIADPNFPGIPQEITFDWNTKKYNPYMGKANATDAPHPYKFISYYAKTALINWDVIGNRWQEFQNGTIGKVNPNAFPAYQIWVDDGTGYELGDTLNTDADSVVLEVVCPTADVSFNRDNKKFIGLNAYNENGDIASVFGTGSKLAQTKLKKALSPGENRIGLYIFSWRNGFLDNPTTYTQKFVDFKWITIYKQSLEIKTTEKNGAPIDTNGLPNIDYKFVAKTNKTAPTNVKYVWNFGDETEPITVLNDSTIEHKFENVGSYVIELKIYNNTTGKIALQGKVNANIGSSFMDILRSTNITWGGLYQLKDGSTNLDDWPIMLSSGDPLNNLGATNQSQSSKSLSKINWDKDKFSTNWQEDLITGFDTKIVASISGVIDSIKQTVKTMEISYKGTVKLDDGRIFSEVIYNISLNNIPLEILGNTLVMGEFSGNDIQNHIKINSYSLRLLISGEYEYRTISTINWTNAKLHASFRLVN